MTPLAHISAGYLAAKIVDYINPSLGFNRPEILLTTIIGANFPDLDFLYVKGKSHHRNTLFHSPLFWLALFLASYFFARIFNLRQIILYVEAFGLGLFTHFFTDWFAARDPDVGGIRIFYPFSKKHYGFMPYQKIKFAGFQNFSLKNFIEFYTENLSIFVVEALIIIVAAAVFLSRNSFFRLGIFQ